MTARTGSRCRRNLPVVPIHDLAVKNQDLVAATHGRAFWILDDLTPLHQLADGIGDTDAHLFTPRPTTRFKSGLRRFHAGGPPQGYLSVGGLAVTTWQDPKPGSPLTFFEAGRNPTDGVIINYYLKEKPDAPISLTFLDAQRQRDQDLQERRGSRQPGRRRRRAVTSSQH